MTPDGTGTRLPALPPRRFPCAKVYRKKESFFTVQRDSMDIDDLKSPSLYFGTTTGQLWIGRDGGEEWDCLFDSLPPIHCVKAAAV